MTEVTTIEKQLLFDLNDRDMFESGEYLIDLSSYLLKEKDAIKRIQEVVFYLERLEGNGFVSLENGFYEESDKISFDYMNSATDIDFNKVHITDAGKAWLEEHGLSWIEKEKRKIQSGINAFFENKRRVVFGYIITFTLGLITGMLLR